MLKHLKKADNEVNFAKRLWPVMISVTFTDIHLCFKKVIFQQIQELKWDINEIQKGTLSVIK